MPKDGTAKVNVLALLTGRVPGEKETYSQVSVAATLTVVRIGAMFAGGASAEPIEEPRVMTETGPGIVVDEQNRVLGIVNDPKDMFPFPQSQPTWMKLTRVADIDRLRTPHIAGAAVGRRGFE